VRRVLRLSLVLLLLAAVAGALWWAWMGWDHEYYTDPATGYAAGPYRPWQVVGCVLSLVVAAVAAYRFVDRIAVGVAMTLGFTVAFAATVVPPDESGMAGVGVLFLLTGMSFGAAALGTADAAAAAGLQRARRPRVLRSRP